MSSPTGKTSSSQSPPNPKDAAALQPVQTNPSTRSQALRHVIPPAILGAFCIGFARLVEDPVPAMLNLLAVVVALQIPSVLVCMPVAGSQPAKAARKPRPGEKRKEGGGGGPSLAVAALLSVLLTTFTVPLLHVVLVLFGAPFLTHIPHTLLCAAHLASLVAFPLFYVHGVDAAAWLAVAGFRAPLDETFGGLVGAVAGAWLGAVPIPLDWDREWQKWPVTILCGMYAGYVAGRVLGGTVLYGKRFGS